LGRGRPRFPPDSACPAVLTITMHAANDRFAYGTLTPCGDPFQRSSAPVARRAKPLPRPPIVSSNPDPASPAGCAAASVWAPPRSLAATQGIFSLPRGTEMFQFPRYPPRIAPGCPGVPRAGCPIRTPPDRWLPAPPRSISPRGRVLPRPPAPRHPPCARLADHSPHFIRVIVAVVSTTPNRRAPE
jgi:hypothetical protein